MSSTETNAVRPLKGYRTLILNGAVVILPVVLGWIAGVDWKDYVSPQAAAAIVGAANFGLRFFTSTPVGKAG